MQRVGHRIKVLRGFLTVQKLVPLTFALFKAQLYTTNQPSYGDGQQNPVSKAKLTVSIAVNATN